MRRFNWPLIGGIAYSLAVWASVLAFVPGSFAQQVGPNVFGSGTYGPPFGNNGAHLFFGGGAPPAINSACGTGASVPVGTDSSFFFKTGTSSSSSCTVTFAAPWNNPPNCSVDGTNAVTFTVTTSALLMTGALDSQTYNVICIGRPGG